MKKLEEDKLVLDQQKSVIEEEKATLQDEKEALMKERENLDKEISKLESAKADMVKEQKELQGVIKREEPVARPPNFCRRH